MLRRSCLFYVITPRIVEILRCGMGLSVPAIRLPVAFARDLLSEIEHGAWPAASTTNSISRSRSSRALARGERIKPPTGDLIKAKDAVTSRLLRIVASGLSNEDDIPLYDLEALHELCMDAHEWVLTQAHEKEDANGLGFPFLDAPSFAENGERWLERCGCDYVLAGPSVHAWKTCRLHTHKRIGYVADQFSIFDEGIWRIRAGEHPAAIEPSYKQMVARDLKEKGLGWAIIERPDEWSLLNPGKGSK